MPEPVRRLDENGRRALAYASEEARTLRHERVGTEHLLLGLLRLDGGAAVEALDAVGVTLGRARAEVVRTFGTGSGSPGGDLPLTPRAKKRLELAGDEAEALGDAQGGSGHLLLSLTREREGGAARVLVGLGVDGTELLGETRKRLGRAPEVRDIAPASTRAAAAGPAWALPMLVGALLLGAGILIGWTIWG
jgi:ATP-dependent Clp protease ATP-binding subunit ClpC